MEDELKEIRRKIIELNYDILLAMTYNDMERIKEIRLETNKQVKVYLEKLEKRKL